VSETLDLFSAENGDSADLSGPASSGTYSQPVGVAESAGTSHDRAGAVRSSPDAVHTATGGDEASANPAGGVTSRARGLTAMLLPELQRVAQSMGITGTARMRKGQLIAAIEERRQGGAPQEASSIGRSGGGFGAVAARDQEPTARQIETSNNSVQRGAPAGAGTDRTFEQDAMESQTSTQPGLGGSSSSGIGEASRSADAGIGGAPAGGATAMENGGVAVNGTPRDDAQQPGDG